MRLCGGRRGLCWRRGSPRDEARRDGDSGDAGRSLGLLGGGFPVGLRPDLLVTAVESSLAPSSYLLKSDRLYLADLASITGRNPRSMRPSPTRQAPRVAELK